MLIPFFPDAFIVRTMVMLLVPHKVPHEHDAKFYLSLIHLQHVVIMNAFLCYGFGFFAEIDPSFNILSPCFYW